MAAASKPLAGRRVVVTRAAGEESPLARALEALGAEALRLPVISFAPPEDWGPVDAALDRAASFDWILFTSRNAVRFLCRRARERKLDLRALLRSAAAGRAAKLGVVGPATAETAAEEGLRVDYVAKDRTGESLGRELAHECGEALRGAEVLLPRSDRADSRLPGALREGGARVTEVTAYRTAVPGILDAEVLARTRRAEVDAIVFASPSAFQNLMLFTGAAELDRLSSRVAFAAIGPVTASAIREAGARVAVEARDPSAAGVAEAIAAYYGDTGE